MGRIARMAAMVGCLVFGTAAVGQQVIVIGNDMGGIVGNRADEIRRINAAGTRVEIRGDVCISSCTMYLGVGDVCVSPALTSAFTDQLLRRPTFPNASSNTGPGDSPATTTRRCATGSCERPISQLPALYGVGEELIRIGYRSCVLIRPRNPKKSGARKGAAFMFALRGRSIYCVLLVCHVEPPSHRRQSPQAALPQQPGAMEREVGRPSMVPHTDGTSFRSPQSQAPALRGQDRVSVKLAEVRLGSRPSRHRHVSRTG